MQLVVCMGEPPLAWAEAQAEAVGLTPAGLDSGLPHLSEEGAMAEAMENGSSAAMKLLLATGL